MFGLAREELVTRTETRRRIINNQLEIMDKKSKEIEALVQKELEEMGKRLEMRSIQQGMIGNLKSKLDGIDKRLKKVEKELSEIAKSS